MAVKSGWRDRQKIPILVELTVCQKSVANALNSVVIILKNKVLFVTFPFFFMVELQNFLNAPRNMHVLSKAALYKLHWYFWQLYYKLCVVLFVAQSFLNYALLCIIFTTSHAFRTARNVDCCTVKKQHILLYVLVSVVDVEANYLVVKAYQYTTVTSVQVLPIINYIFKQLMMFISWIIM